MSASVLAIVIAVGEASNPATAALRATAQESLGSGTSILLVEAVQPTDAEALRVERDLGAGVVVLVVWRESAHLHAVLRLHVANGNRWVTREIGFSSEDTLEERGRTLGFTIGSIWPETERGPRPSPEPRPPPEGRAPTPSNAPHEQSSSVASRAPTEDAPPTLPGSEVESPPRRAPAPLETTPFWPVRVGISAVGALGLGGPAYGLGAAAEGELFLTSDLGLRMGASLRAGSISELPGRDVASSLAAGLEWWPLPTSSARPVGLGLAFDMLALHHQVTATGAGQAESRGRFMPGADVLLSAGFRLTSRVEAIARLGAEMAFGTTDIRTGSPPQTVATIPALREIAEAGFRLGF